MRKVVKEYNVYKFDELEKDIQDEILERYMRYEHESYCDLSLEDDMRDIATELLNKYFKDAVFKNLYYDLSYSQGSGSMIEFELDLKDLNDKYKRLNVDELKELENFGGTNIKIRHNNSHYYHEFTYSIDYNDFTCFGYEWETIKNIEKLQDDIISMIQDDFEKDIIRMNKELTRKGYGLLEDEEYFKELAMMTISEKEFLENGDEFYE